MDELALTLLRGIADLCRSLGEGREISQARGDGLNLKVLIKVEESCVRSIAIDIH